MSVFAIFLPDMLEEGRMGRLTTEKAACPFQGPQETLLLRPGTSVCKEVSLLVGRLVFD